jgi:hypothetical protein
MSADRHRSKLRRVDASTTIDVSTVPQPELFFTNHEQFESIDDAVALLFYTETDDDVIFDPVGDADLLGLHTKPFSFENTTSLRLYESLTTRARYHCKPHPNQVLAREEASQELSIPADDLLFFVYERDTAATSPVKQRRRTPFRNETNGIGAHSRSESVLLTLFNKLSFDPFASGTIVWQREQRASGIVGLIGIRVEKLFQ